MGGFSITSLNVASATPGSRLPPQEAFGHTLDAVDAVTHRGVAVGQDCDRHPGVMILQPRHLMDELPAPRGAPPALEEHLPSAWSGHRRDAPALVADDVGELVIREVAEPIG